MARSIATYRARLGLPPIPCVKLENVSGEYWRFHQEGNSALSTIEAISYTALSAGMPEDDHAKLLTLFQIQKGRVLMSMTDPEGKAPRAICVHGTGDGSWTNVFIEPMPISV